jgi:hypothetical protein
MGRGRRGRDCCCQLHISILMLALEHCCRALLMLGHVHAAASCCCLAAPLHACLPPRRCASACCRAMVMSCCACSPRVSSAAMSLAVVSQFWQSSHILAARGDCTDGSARGVVRNSISFGSVNRHSVCINRG